MQTLNYKGISNTPPPPTHPPPWPYTFLYKIYTSRVKTRPILRFHEVEI